MADIRARREVPHLPVRVRAFTRLNLLCRIHVSSSCALCLCAVGRIECVLLDILQ